MTDPAARFSPGDRVRVLARPCAGHVRTPAYAQGRGGVVVAWRGAFPDPEARAYGQPGTRRDLFTIEFPSADLWADGSSDLVRVDIYDHWLAAEG